MDEVPTYPKAVAERRRMIEALTICKCLYPLVRYRNGSGHEPDCPAHLASPFATHIDGKDGG